METKIILSTEEDFFKRGKQIVNSLDNSLPIATQKIISFEDPEDLFNYILDLDKEDD